MKWIYSLLLFVSIASFGQSDDSAKYIHYPYQYGIHIPRLWADSVLKAKKLVKFTGLTPSTDTTTYKPLSIDASGNVSKMVGWPGGTINLDTTRDATSVTILNSGGADAVIPLVNVTNNKAGLISPASQAFLDSLKNGLIDDSLVVDNSGTGQNILFVRSDTLFGKRIQAGTNITVTTASDSSIVIDAAGGAALANNGLSMDGDTVELGQAVGAGGNPGRLLSEREVPLNGFGINFLGSTVNNNFNILSSGAVRFGTGTGSSSAPSIQLGATSRGIWSGGSGEVSIVGNIGTPSYLHVKDGGLTASGVVISDNASGVPVRGRLTVRETSITTASAVDFRVINSTATFAPTSGTATLRMLQIDPTINQTGSATGLSRGIYINPTMTAVTAAGWRGIELDAFGTGLYAIKQNGTADTIYLSGKIRTPNLVAQVDTSSYKPVVVDAAGNQFQMAGWPKAGITSINSQTGPSISISGDATTGISVSAATNTVTIATNTTLESFGTDANNTGTGETDLYSHTLAANKLTLNGKGVRFRITGTNNDATATAQIKGYFAGTEIFDSGALTMSAAGDWVIDMEVQRTTSTTAAATVTFSCTNTTVTLPVKYTALTSQDWTVTNIFKITGTAGGGGGGSNDITAHAGKVVFVP